MKIDSNTFLLGVIGYPIRHSLSPIIHNPSFQRLGINAVYLAFEVKKEDLGDAIRGVRALGIKGLSVTIPHKIDVMEYLDEIDEISKLVGAVNTIKNEGGKLFGTNTDVIGAFLALKNNKVELEGKTVLILGSGGASRAVAFSSAKLGNAKKIIISARNPTTRKQLENSLQANNIETISIDIQNIKEYINEADIIINTTPVGMYPNIDELPLDPNLLKPSHVVFDIIYNPLETKLLKEAKKKGCKTISGLEMFIYQALEQQKYWFGVSVEYSFMKKLIRGRKIL